MLPAQVRREHAAAILAEGLVRLLERRQLQPNQPPQQLRAGPDLRLVPERRRDHEER